jgi:hypothetical protein
VPGCLQGPPPRFETQDGVSWSSALRLWVKKGASVELTLRKLEHYVQVLAGATSSCWGEAFVYRVGGPLLGPRPLTSP